MVFVWLRLVFLTVPTFYLLLVSFIGYFINLPFSFLSLLPTWLQLDLLWIRQIAQVLTRMDLQCLSSQSTNFALSHSITLLAILFFVMLSVNSPCPASQPTGFWWPLKALFKNECNICYLPFLWCLAISTAAVVLYWIGQQFQVWVASELELLSETVWSQHSVNTTFIVLS